VERDKFVCKIGSRPTQGSAERRPLGAAFFGYFLCRSKESITPAGRDRHLKYCADRRIKPFLTPAQAGVQWFEVISLLDTGLRRYDDQRKSLFGTAKIQTSARLFNDLLACSNAQQ
jgi:hypothetical protein